MMAVGASPRSRARRRTALLALVGLLLAAASWAFIFEPASLRVQEYRVAPGAWPTDCSGLRIAVLADLHTGSPFNGLDKLDRVIELTQAAKPDLILLTGDYVIQGVLGGRFVSPEEAAASLQRLRAPMGVWAVLGNHDAWLDAPRVRRAFEARGIPVLEDRSVPIQAGACRLRLAGISDFWEGRHDVPTALAEVAEGDTVVAATHNPDVFPEVPSRVSLTIAGHTHGGQVRLPFLGPPIVPSRYGQRYASGHIVESGRHLFVSPGIGTSILPVRFLVPPEISLLVVSGSRETAQK